MDPVQCRPVSTDPSGRVSRWALVIRCLDWHVCAGEHRCRPFSRQSSCASAARFESRQPQSRLNDRQWCTGRKKARHAESCMREQRPVLPLSSFATSHSHEHVDVEQLCFCRLLIVEDHAFDNEQPGRGRHSLTTRVEDSAAGIIIPVVKHALEEVYIEAVRQIAEKIACDKRRPASETGIVKSARAFTFGGSRV